MDKLEALPPVARLSDCVLRILGQNPGKFTLQGTNTYVLGRRSPFILVDTGEGKESYISYLEDVLKQTGDTSQQLISDIILTHKHHDHTHGLPSVLALLKRLWPSEKPDFRPPRIHKYPLPLHSSDTDFRPILDSLPANSFTPTPQNGIIHELQKQQTLHGSDISLRILHTPGHTDDSICLYLPEEKVLLTADTVLGQGTAVFENLAEYMASLRSLLQFGSQSNNEFVKLYPGHGPVVEDGPILINNYIAHRMEREEQIVQVLSLPPPSGDAWTIRALVAHIYSAYPQSLWGAAAHGMFLHLMKLKGENRADHLDGEGQESRWTLRSNNNISQYT